ncbi:MAG: YhjD/YihY/BrkB family envelope integrity protein, partial [Thermodesulfobacteriota bacterium]
LADTIRNYRANGDTNQAAAIALYALLSIIPFFILTLLMVGGLFSANPEIEQRLIEEIRQFFPSFSGALLSQLGQIQGKKEVLGWVGIISLIWFSAMIFGAIETALNMIFRSRSYRNYFVSKLLAIAMIPTGWAIGVASVVMTYVAAVLAEQPMLGEIWTLYFPALHGMFIRYLLPYLVTVVFCTIVYKVIPTVEVDLKSALIGGAVFSVLVEIAKQFFTWYIARYTRYNIIFGSLEAVVILVLWVFYIALILLFCAELISSYQRRDRILLEKVLLEPGKGLPRMDDQLFRKFGRLYNPNEYIFHEGDVGQELFYILSGRVQIEKRAGHVKKVLADMGPGAYFGEMAALIQSPRSSSARALEACHIAVIGGDMLRDILRESGEVSLFMLKEFSRRIIHTNASLAEMTQSWIRLTATLYFLRMWPLAEDRNPVASLMKATGKDAAEIQEILADLDRRGVLSFRGGRVTAFNREAALRLVDERATA